MQRCQTGARPRYWLTLLSGMLECLCFAGVIFGFASLMFVLKVEGYFSQLCSDIPGSNSSRDGTGEPGGGGSSCNNHVCDVSPELSDAVLQLPSSSVLHRLQQTEWAVLSGLHCGLLPQQLPVSAERLPVWSLRHHGNQTPGHVSPPPFLKSKSNNTDDSVGYDIPASKEQEGLKSVAAETVSSYQCTRHSKAFLQFTAGGWRWADVQIKEGWERLQRIDCTQADLRGGAEANEWSLESLMWKMKYLIWFLNSRSSGWEKHF